MLWTLHKKKLLNMIWTLILTRIEYIKVIKLFFEGHAVFISENIVVDILMEACNGSGSGYEDYL